MNVLDTFSGAGGGILASQLLGHNVVCAIENNEFARDVLVSNQNAGVFSPFPIWDDVSTFDGREWSGVVDIVQGGFPCQDVSAASTTGAGIDGAKSSLFWEQWRIFEETQAEFIFIENAPTLRSRGLEKILEAFAHVGLDAEWTNLSAAEAGAPHKRDRLWILGHRPNAHRKPIRHESERNAEGRLEIQGERKTITQRNGLEKPMADSDSSGLEEQRRRSSEPQEHAAAQRGGWWTAEPALGRVVDGLANRTHQLRCLGNGQVPAVAAMAFKLLKKRLEEQ